MLRRLMATEDYASGGVSTSTSQCRHTRVRFSNSKPLIALTTCVSENQAFVRIIAPARRAMSAPGIACSFARFLAPERER